MAGAKPSRFRYFRTMSELLKKERIFPTHFTPFPPRKRSPANITECGSVQDVLRGDVYACPLASAVTSTGTLPLLPLLLLEERLECAMGDLNLQVEQYTLEFFTIKMGKQATCSLKISDMPRRITARMRAILVDWLVQVHEYFTMEEETLYLAIYLMNLFLKAINTPLPMLQLLGATCLFLACKLEEDSYPEPDLLCSLMENTYDKKAVLKMERRILSALKFELHYSNPLLFLRLLATVGKCSIKSQYLAMYFMELTLLEPEAVTFEPAHLAAAGLYLAQKTLPEAELESFTDIREGPYKLYPCSEDELHPIQHLMAHAALRASASDIKASFLKYSMPPKMCVSTVCTQHLDSLVNRLPSWEDFLLMDGEHDLSANGQRLN